MILRVARFAVLVSLLLATPSLAQSVLPRNDGWVTDQAGMLTPQQEQALETLMESYKRGSGHEIALLTVPDLGGRSLERYALEVARGWRIGAKGTNAGALLLVTRKERKIRIEVGRGLEGRITDSISGRIIRNVIAPEFRRGDFHAGLRAGVEALHAAAGGDYGKIPGDRGGSSVFGVLPLIFFLFLFLTAARRAGRGRSGPRGCLPWLVAGTMMNGGRRGSGWHGGTGGGFGGGGFSGFGGGGGFSGGGASGGW